MTTNGLECALIVSVAGQLDSKAALSHQSYRTIDVHKKRDEEWYFEAAYIAWMHPAIRILSLAADFASVHTSDWPGSLVLHQWIGQDQRNWDCTECLIRRS